MDKLICVGKNYLEHARELGDLVPETPVLFLKPPSVLQQAARPGDLIHAPSLPIGRGDVHHECEIVVRIARDSGPVDVAGAADLIDAVTLGLDMTLRTEQNRLKKAGHPWELGKVFAGSALLGSWWTGADVERLLNEEFSFEMGGKVRQRGRASDMTLSPAHCIAHASAYFPLCAGDIVFTGTPAGVGPVIPGDRGVARWGDRVIFHVAW